MPSRTWSTRCLKRVPPSLAREIANEHMRRSSARSPLVGVLGRKVGGNDPLVPFNPVAEGFAGARGNRLKVISWFETHSEAEYTLYGTAPDGTKVQVASVKDGKLTKYNEPMYDDLITDPGDEGALLGDKVITQDGINKIVAGINDPKYATQVADDLKPYINKTWKDALNAHSKQRPEPVASPNDRKGPDGHE